MSIERKECETLSLSDDNEVALQKKISNSISQKKYSVGRKSKIIFMFPGQGSDYKYMGKQLYESQDVFKKHLEECNEIIKSKTGYDIINIYFYSTCEPGNLEWNERVIITLNAILAIEYSLAKLLISYGVIPDALIGYSMGEVTAGIISSVFSLKDGINLITAVAENSRELDNGALLAVKTTPEKIKHFLNADVEIASINHAEAIILGGNRKAIRSVSRTLLNAHFFVKNINIPCSYHTSYVKFLEKKIFPIVEKIQFSKAKIPIFSSGMFDENKFTPILYWSKFFSSQMNLLKAFQECLLDFPESFFIEVGPSLSMSTTVRKIKNNVDSQSVLSLQSEMRNEESNLMTALAKASLNGCNINRLLFQKNKEASKKIFESIIFEFKNRSSHYLNFKLDVEKKIIPPRNTKEKLIHNIFKNILIFEKISVNDNFFMIGGDSLLAIQCVTLLNESGFDVDLNYFMRHSSIAALAVCSKKIKKNFVVEEISESLPLIPLQIRFFRKPKHSSEQKLMPLFVLAGKDIDETFLRLSCEELIRQHDTLRIRFKYDCELWSQCIAQTFQLKFHVINLQSEIFSKVDIEKIIVNEQAKFSLNNDSLVKFIFIKSCNKSIFIMLCHHLCVDGVSASILMNDIAYFYNKFKHSLLSNFPKKTTSFQKWANHLLNFSKLMTHQDVEFWRNCMKKKLTTMPVDYKNHEENMSSGVQEFTFDLNEDDTELCLRKIPFLTNGAGVLEILLYACAKGYYRWTNIKEFYVDLRSHGRNINFENIDLSRTVGWLTVVFPFLIDLNKEDVSSKRFLNNIYNDLKSIPYNGLSYGLLRYMVDDKKIQQEMENIPKAEIAFNYHGQLDHIQRKIKPFTMLKAPIANSQSSSVTRSHLINIDSAIFNKEITITISYNNSIHQIETIKKYGSYIFDEIKTILASVNRA